MCKLRGFFHINPVQKKIHKQWFENVEVILIAKKLDIEDEDLHTPVLSRFGSNKSDHKKYGFALVLHLFRDISCFK